MFRAIVIGIVFFALLVTSGCTGGSAITQANLDVSYNLAKAKVGPLSSVKPLKVEVGTFADKRQVTDRIGDKRNYLGWRMAKIVTTRPVPEIVREAIVSAFNKNGHIVTSDEKDIVVSGEIETFWFEYQANTWEVEFMGTVDVNMVVQDSRTGQVLFSKRYSGYHNTALKGGYHKEMADEMNAALENLTDQISNDPKLIEVLKSYSASPATSTIPVNK